MFNARCETVHEKPSFRRLASRRCVVLVDGFYEWKKQTAAPQQPSKQPYYISQQQGSVMYLAGLYDTFDQQKRRPKDHGEEQEDLGTLFTFTILTRSVSSSLAWLHDREPVMLSKSGAHDWLSRTDALMKDDEIYSCTRDVEDLLQVHPVTAQGQKLEYLPTK